MSKIMELVRRVLVSESNEDLNLIQAEVTRMEEELSAVKGLHWNAEAKVAELRAKLAALEAQEPFWHAVVSKQSPIVNKAMRRRDIAEEYADQCRPHYSGVEVVALYLAAGAKP